MRAISLTARLSRADADSLRGGFGASGRIRLRGCPVGEVLLDAAREAGRTVRLLSTRT